MILSGSKDATLRQVQLVSLHGTEFFDVVFAHDDAPEQLVRSRVDLRRSAGRRSGVDRVPDECPNQYCPAQLKQV